MGDPADLVAGWLAGLSLFLCICHFIFIKMDVKEKEICCSKTIIDDVLFFRVAQHIMTILWLLLPWLLMSKYRKRITTQCYGFIFGFQPRVQFMISNAIAIAALCTNIIKLFGIALLHAHTHQCILLFIH